VEDDSRESGRADHHSGSETGTRLVCAVKKRCWFFSFKVLTGHGATIDTTTPSGKLVFGFFAALSVFERELIVERTKAGLAAARTRGRSGGRPCKMTRAKLRLAMASMGKPETKVGDLCAELGVTRHMLYRHVGPDGTIRPDGRKLLRAKGACGAAAADVREPRDQESSGGLGPGIRRSRRNPFVRQGFCLSNGHWG